MAIVMFAFICDHCGKRGPEYTVMPGCRECGEDVCEDCYLPKSHDAECNLALCNRCATSDDFKLRYA